MRGQKDIMARRGRQRGGQWPFVLGACSDIFLQAWVVLAKIPLARSRPVCKSWAARWSVGQEWPLR